MTEIAEFLRARYREARLREEGKRRMKFPGPFDGHEVSVDSDGRVLIDDHEYPAEKYWELASEPGADPDVLADLDAKLALVDEFAPPPPAEREATETEAGWCCLGTLGRVSECPLCPQYGTRLDDPCPGHPGTSPNKTRVVEARLHAAFQHPEFEYRTTEGPRKQWGDVDEPPYGDDGEPDPTWERNIDAGRPGMGWDRFDHTEEAYWRRRRADGPRPEYIPRPLRILAQPFVGHPDHKGEEWAP